MKPPRLVSWCYDHSGALFMISVVLLVASMFLHAVSPAGAATLFVLAMVLAAFGGPVTQVRMYRALYRAWRLNADASRKPKPK